MAIFTDRFWRTFAKPSAGGPGDPGGSSSLGLHGLGFRAEAGRAPKRGPKMAIFWGHFWAILAVFNVHINVHICPAASPATVAAEGSREGPGKTPEAKIGHFGDFWPFWSSGSKMPSEMGPGLRRHLIHGFGAREWAKKGPKGPFWDLYLGLS